MKQELESLLLKTFKAEAILGEELIQSLWSNYGQLLRVQLNEGELDSVIVKVINTSKAQNHPRGWDTDISHQRKLKSYSIEANWYKSWVSQCDDLCRVPKCLLIQTSQEGLLLVLEDLDEVGFNERKIHLSLNEVKLCLDWLANFHAVFMNEEPKSLWEIGTYWHLATRPDELDKMGEGFLKQSAQEIDRLLNQCKYKTIVHGDAKVANFCFDTKNNKVAAVDFQYVGGGSGMKDVIYFLSSCLTEEECELYEEEVLDYYFDSLKTALDKSNKLFNFNELEVEWRRMYVLAWSDFLRFLEGWAPDHYKINSYNQKLVKQVIKNLN